MKEFATKPLSPSHTLDNKLGATKRAERAQTPSIEIILQRYEESMRRYALSTDAGNTPVDEAPMNHSSCALAQSVIQGVFLDLEGREGQDFILENRAFITTINDRITTLLRGQEEKMRWLESFPDELKLDWVSYLVSQGKKEAERVVEAVCSALIKFPFDIDQLPRSKNTLRKLMGMETSFERLFAEESTLPRIDKTVVESIDIQKDVYEFDVVKIDKEGRVIGVEKEKMIHPVFRDVAGTSFSFIKVVLPSDVTEETFDKPIEHDRKKYKINVIAGSSLKPTIGNAGSVYGIEDGSEEILKKVLGFEESSYYAQRAFFPLVVGGVKGQIKGRALPVGDKDKKTFLLKDGTPVQLEDGWGYIIRSLADQMQERGLSREKRSPVPIPGPGPGLVPVPESGRASYQMYEWLNTEDPEVVHELVQSGRQAWNAFFQANPQLVFGFATTQDVDKLKILHSILTTGKPAMEMSVAMPVGGDKIVVPDHQRFTGKINDKQGVSLIRSPADKQNFYPVESAQIDKQGNISRFITEMEGLQYTLTGKDRGALTFFKGMLGVIPDEQWPDEWKGLDLVVTSKDRKLYENWEKDSSLQEEEGVGTAQKDRATAHATAQDFLIQGNLIATQWFEKGSFVGIPNAIQKWLGGDYDGDEVGMIFESRNPYLYRTTKDAFKKEEVNPKLKKTFSYRPGSSRRKRIMDMRSTNVGMWSNLAARVNSLPEKQLEELARMTSEGRLSPADSSRGGVTESQRMMEEIQLGIKVGTDAFKTDSKISDFEKRAREYKMKLDSLSSPIQHHRKLQDLMAKIRIHPTLESPEWRNIYFSYDTIDATTGEYEIKGLSPRILHRMIRFLLSPDELLCIDVYYSRWLAETQTDWMRYWSSGRYFLTKIDEYNRETLKGATANYIQRAFSAYRITTYDDFEKAYFLTVAWYWQRFNSYAWNNYREKNVVWKQGLTRLLKQYYALSF